MQTNPNQTRRIYRYVNGTCLVLLVAVLTLLTIAQGPDTADGPVRLFGRDMPATCAIRALTGRPCFGCGATRAMAIALDGQPARAHTIHPSALWTLLWAGLQLLARATLLAIGPRRRLVWTIDGALSFITFIAAMYLPVIVRLL
ncbi:MAG: DUF2752 domain-containing protein [bacterium]|nr:DUF2752 domain-containing protein [bacterium]